MSLVIVGLYIVFWSSLFLLLHTYVIYPLIMRLRAGSKSINSLVYHTDDEWPQVSILMAAYNEEAVIERKLESLLVQDYPQDKINFFFGSDNSTDKTNLILHQAEQKNSQVSCHYFKERTGKPGIINQLAQEALWLSDVEGDHVFLMTDASVILERDTISKIVKHFKNPQVGLVDAHMHYTGLQKKGISTSEDTYLSSEVLLKHNQSKVTGKMIGPFGGCFAIRAELFHPVPKTYLVDDFFLAMKVLEQDKLVINELEAICREPVSHKLSEEYRRKQRISTGNFQNLVHFRKLLLPGSGIAFSFLSHKVLRWIGPFLMLLMVGTSGLLALFGSTFFSFILGGLGLWFAGIPIFDYIISKWGINFSLTRNIRYFNLMNLALLSGFWRYTRGVKTNVWQPTSRE